MNRLSVVARALVSRRWWWVTLLVVALMIVLARLGVWQLNRLEERRVANVQLRAALDAPPVLLNDADAELSEAWSTEAAQTWENRLVTAGGEFDYTHQLILLLQNRDGRAGIHLITPLVLVGTDTVVLVDRGWLPEAAAAADRSQYEPGEPVNIDGYIALSETLSRAAAGDAPPITSEGEIYRVDIPAIEPALPYDLLPFYVKQLPDGAGAAELPLRDDRTIDLSEGPHLGYAVQWFIFSLGLGLGYLAYVNSRTA